MVSISRPWLVPVFAVMAVVFWGWVAFWFLIRVPHGCEGPPQPSVTHGGTSSVITAPTTGTGAPPPEWLLRQAIRAADPRLQAMARYLPVAGRVDLRVSIAADGWPYQAGVMAEGAELSPRARRGLERAILSTRFPQHADAYQLEWTVVFQQ